MASALHQRKTAVIEYRPVAVNGDHEWYWSLLPLPEETHALATGSAKNRGTAAMLARQEARKQGYLVSKVRIQHAMAENARRRILTLIKLRENADDPDANPQNDVARAWDSPIPGYETIRGRAPSGAEYWKVMSSKHGEQAGLIFYDTMEGVPAIEADIWKEWRWHAQPVIGDGRYLKSFDEAVRFLADKLEKRLGVAESEDPDKFDPRQSAMQAFELPAPYETNYVQWRSGGHWEIRIETVDKMYHELIGQVAEFTNGDLYKWGATPIGLNRPQYFTTFDDAANFIIQRHKELTKHRRRFESDDPDQIDPRERVNNLNLQCRYKVVVEVPRDGDESYVASVDLPIFPPEGTPFNASIADDKWEEAFLEALRHAPNPRVVPTDDIPWITDIIYWGQSSFFNEAEDPDALGAREMNHAFDWRAQIKAMGFQAHYNGTVETDYTLDSAPYRFIVRTTARRDNSLSVEAYIEGTDGFQPLFQEFVVPTMVQPVVRQLLQGKIDESDDPDTFDAKAQLMRGLDEKDFTEFLGTLHRGFSFEIFWRSEPLGRDLEEQSFQMEYTKAEGALTRADIGRVERSVKRYLIRHGWQIEHFYGDQTHEPNARWISFGIKHVITESDDPDAVNLQQHIPNTLDWRKALMERGFNDLSNGPGYYVRCVGRHTLRVWPNKSMLSDGAELGKMSIQIYQEENGQDEFLRAEGVDPVDLGARIDQLIAEYSVNESAENPDEFDPQAALRAATPTATSLDKLFWEFDRNECRTLLAEKDGASWHIKGWVWATWRGGLKKVKRSLDRFKIPYTNMGVEYSFGEANANNTEMNRTFFVDIPWYSLSMGPHAETMYPPGSKVRVD